MGLRDAARRRLEARLRARSATPSAGELARSAVVFAPHPDDETLACGGTIAAKRRAGGEVHVVFMTDGAASHAAFVPRAEAREVRAREALAACEQLGVERDAVTFLEFADGTLQRHVAAATDRTGRIIEALRPLDVYVPCRGDGHADHDATREAVLAAVGRGAAARAVYQYPVWYWQHWPWVRLPLRPRGLDRAAWQRSALAWCGLRLGRRFNRVLDVSGFAGQKRAALDAYASQVTRRNDDPRWPVLGDVAAGDWLACFFRGYELFRGPYATVSDG